MNSAQPELTPDDIFDRFLALADHINLDGRAFADLRLAPCENGAPAFDKLDHASLLADVNLDEPVPVDDAGRLCLLIHNISATDCEIDVIAYVSDGNVNLRAIGAEGTAAADWAKTVVWEILGQPQIVPKRRPVAAWIQRPFKDDPPPAAANDNEPLLPIVDPSGWAGRPVPARDWFVEGLIPARTVTLLSGDGGLGKSLIALQLGIASALGKETMGVAPVQCRTLYVGAEDETAEFHRRIDSILRAMGATYGDLGGGFLLAPLADRDAVMAAPDRSGTMQPTKLMAALVAKVAEFRPGLLVLDTSADVFGGDEIKRSQVRQFVSALRKLAIEADCSVLLLSHPSVSGMQSGSGTSGSTAWNNSVRSRLYLTAPEGKRDEPEDTEARVLTTMKANYGKKGEAIKLRWRDGVFVPDTGDVPNVAARLLGKKAEDIFLDLLSRLTRQGQTLSPNPSPSFAPKVMAEHPDGGGITKKQFAAAMQRLLDDDKIRIVEEGPPSRRYKRLWVASECFGDRPSNSASN